MTPPHASEHVVALEDRMSAMEGDIKEIRQTTTRIESAIIGLDGKGGLLRKVERMDEEVAELKADYHARKGVQQFVAPFWAVVGGLAVVLGDKLVGRFF